MLELAATRVEVPAGGQATVGLTIDASGKPAGEYPGVIAATSGETVVRTVAGAYVEPEMYDVTVNATEQDGTPADAYVLVHDPATGAGHDLFLQDGTGKIRLPKGEWKLHTEIGNRELGRMFAHSSVRVDGPGRQVTIDGRRAEPVRITLDDQDARQLGEVGYAWKLGAWEYFFSGGGTSAGVKKLRLVPVREDGLSLHVRTFWESSTVSPSPYLYDLVTAFTGGYPEAPAHDVRQADLAKVTATYRAAGRAGKGLPLSGPRLGGWSLLSSIAGEVDLPATRTYYRTPGLVWESQFQSGDTALVTDGGRLHKRGHSRELWNAAVSGPSLARPGGSRTGDRITVAAGDLFADSVAGRTGTDAAATGTATLTKDGEVLATAALAGCRADTPGSCELRASGLPGEAATYRLSTSMRRQVPHSALSTAVEAIWTFRSSHTREGEPLPLMVVRLAPAALDALNQAKAGSLTRLPIRVEPNPGSAARAANVRLEMSTDDGTTWRRVPVVPGPAGWTGLVPNPGSAGFVSLRVRAGDASGAEVVQTVIRAYGIRP